MLDAAISRGLLPMNFYTYPWTFSRLNYAGGLNGGGVSDISYEEGKRAGVCFFPPHPDTVVTCITQREEMKTVESLMEEARTRLATLGFLQLKETRPLKWVVLKKGVYEETVRKREYMIPLQKNPRYIISPYRGFESCVDTFLKQEGDEFALLRPRSGLERLVKAAVQRYEINDYGSKKLYDAGNQDWGGIASGLCITDYLYEELAVRRAQFPVEVSSSLFGKRFSDFPNPCEPLRSVLKMGYLPSKYSLFSVFLREVPDYLFPEPSSSLVIPMKGAQ